MARKAQPEQALQKACVRFLGVALPPSSLVFSVPNEGVRSRGAAAAMIAAGLHRGAADLMALVPHFGIFAFELKAGRNTLTELQVRFGERWKDAGGYWCEIRSPEALEDFLRDVGVPLRATIQPLKYRPAAASAGLDGSVT